MKQTVGKTALILVILFALLIPGNAALLLRQSTPTSTSAIDDPVGMLTDSYTRTDSLLLDDVISSRLVVAQEPQLDALWARHLGLFMTRGSQTENSVALTFDDGPHPIFTRRLLAVLKAYNVHATFFVVGKLAERHPDLIREIYEDGHLIGNHTYSHPNMSKLTEAQAYTEWERNNELIESITGESLHYCRPPGGHYNDAVIRAAVDSGLRIVWFTTNTGDYKRPPASTIVEKALRGAQNGNIILLHSRVQQTIEALPTIINTFRSLGLEFKTVDELQPPYD